MHPIIGVENENRHLAELRILHGKTKGLLKLTTLKPEQRRASIKVLLVRHHSKVRIPPAKFGPGPEAEPGYRPGRGI